MRFWNFSEVLVMRDKIHYPLPGQTMTFATRTANLPRRPRNRYFTKMMLLANNSYGTQHQWWQLCLHHIFTCSLRTPNLHWKCFKTVLIILFIHFFFFLFFLFLTTYLLSNTILTCSLLAFSVTFRVQAIFSYLTFWRFSVELNVI